MNSDILFENSESSSTDKLIRQLAHSSEDLSRSLKRFTKERQATIQAQKLALVEYDEEMKQIEEMYGLGGGGGATDERVVVDHNVLRHLNIDKQSNYLETIQEPNPARITADDLELLERREEKLKFVVDLSEKPPMPSLEEKKDIRENMFFLLEESRIEEMRLELELEQAKEKNDHKLADELGEALYLVQKMNAHKLKETLTEYQPAPFGKNWGTDPDYLLMLKNLQAISEGKQSKHKGKKDLFDSSKTTKKNKSHN